jgi:glutathione S-transferase
MSGLTLHWALASQPGRAVKTLIDMGKIPCTLVDVNIMTRQQRSKEYLEMYPVGKIPVLTDGDFSLGESGAIMIYLCELYPHIVHLYGKTIQERAVVNQYLSWYQSVFRPAMFKPLKMLLGALLFKQKVP